MGQGGSAFVQLDQHCLPVNLLLTPAITPLISAVLYVAPSVRAMPAASASSATSSSHSKPLHVVPAVSASHLLSQQRAVRARVQPPITNAVAHLVITVPPTATMLCLRHRWTFRTTSNRLSPRHHAATLYTPLRDRRRDAMYNIADTTAWKNCVVVRTVVMSAAARDRQGI